MNKYINNFDIPFLKRDASSNSDTPYFFIDNFLEKSFAEEIYNSFPSHAESLKIGKSFNAYKEKNKVQVTKSEYFPPALSKLNELLASEEFVNSLRKIFDIEDLEADPLLTGGGIHQTSTGGRLDVHVDFNYMEDRKLHRRVNLLLYFNKNWKESYGGYFELWDENVKNRIANIEPKFNRLCVFLTSEKSFHGVTEISCPNDVVRQSFATYYYTKTPPKNWNGKVHSTIFKKRPNESFINSIFYNLNKFILKK